MTEGNALFIGILFVVAMLFALNGWRVTILEDKVQRLEDMLK